MNALILAAGRGSRLGDITKDQPKGLTELAGRTLISRQINVLKSAAITHIAAATGYQSKKIEQNIPQCFYNQHWQNSNMVTSFLCCHEFLTNRTTIVSYSDIIYSANTVRLLKESQGDIVICYDPNWLWQWQQRFDNPLDDAESFTIDDAGYLLDIGQSVAVLDDIQGQYMGLFKLTASGYLSIKSILDPMTEDQVSALDMTSLFRLLLDQNIKISLCKNTDFWFEIDNQHDLACCEKHMTRLK